MNEIQITNRKGQKVTLNQSLNRHFFASLANFIVSPLTFNYVIAYKGSFC